MCICSPYKLFKKMSIKLPLNGQKNMELHYRRFKDLRNPISKKKGRIEPYDSSQLAEKFKKEFLVNIDKLEKEIQQVIDQNQSIIDHNRVEQDIIDARKMKLEDRMIALLSFNTVILLYSRFLDSRQMDAKGHLSDPLDDLDSLEAQIVNDENLIQELAAQLEQEDTNVLEASVKNEQNEFDDYSLKQTLRKHQLRFKKLEIERQLKELPKEPKLEQRKLYYINHSELPNDEAYYQKIAEHCALINYANLIQKEANLRKKHADIAIAEERYNKFFAEHNKMWRKKYDKLDELAENYHEISDLRVQIDAVLMDNAKLRFKSARQNDGMYPERREEAFIECLRQASERRLAEISQAKEKIDEMNVILRKRKRHAQKRDKNLDILQKQIDEATRQKDEYEAKVIGIENSVLQMQMKLKECQTLSDYAPPLEVFNEKGKTIPRLEEISKVLEIVAIDKTENQ
ncbi:hypothetical protein TRFO_22132 [Tritrichomonas foetus]|uniref:Uncharacterized protein n=1 Tax=Tritrichomonas foetus TaxID=1144522 RepID=A0A1J4KD31_9EUKA|nr:hypothetical protein TRFO_22132 [Tritrichomonas foetus]|eukprot:OHT09123.1 hypothetical protein TRFO_22132 [Tritrichomonas foetus]